MKTILRIIIKSQIFKDLIASLLKKYEAKLIEQVIKNNPSLQIDVTTAINQISQGVINEAVDSINI